jgi:hypothetical protein
MNLTTIGTVSRRIGALDVNAAPRGANALSDRIA